MRKHLFQTEYELLARIPILRVCTSKPNPILKHSIGSSYKLRYTADHCSTRGWIAILPLQAMWCFVMALPHCFHRIHPVARIPQLAIHLDRDVNDKGLVLDRHRHLSPVWATGELTSSFEQWLAQQNLVSVSQIASWSAQLVDSQQAQVFGRNSEFIASARLDNQISCWAALDCIS